MCGIAGVVGVNANQVILMELLKPITHRGEVHYRYEIKSIPGYGALGMHRLAIFDVNKKKLILTRDSMGIKPLYYSKVQGNILFASEIKSLSKQQEAQKIHEVKPGTIWINNHTKSYFTLQKFSKTRKINFLVQISQLREYLISVVAKHISKGDPKIACLLSGGIDSSIITYLASKVHPHVVAYTLAATNSMSEDLMAAKTLCNELNIQHVIVTPYIEEMQKFYLDFGVYMTESFEPVLVRNAVSYYFLCKQVAKDGFKFCLNGEGADELFGGYDFVMEAPEHNRDNVIWHSLSIIHKTYLQMADRASMFATLEARVPYMNEELVAYCLTLPSRFRVDNNKNKVALRALFKKELPKTITERNKVGMNEGSGYGKNIPTESIYYHAVKNYYDSYPHLYHKDLSRCKIGEVKQSVCLDLNDIEEIYNFAKYCELGYLKLENGANRLQLNTKLNKQLIV